MDTSGTGDRTTRWIVLTVAFAGFMATVDDYIVAVSLPAIARDFDATTSQTALVTVVYLLALVCTLLPFGRLGDVVGHRRVFLLGYVVFVAASAACALAPGLVLLVAARAVQGMGAAMLSVTGPALIAHHVDEGRRGWAFGILSTVTALGITLGAPLGGLISGLLSWHAVFLVNIPVGLAAAAVAVRTLPDDRPDPRADRTAGDDRRRLDVAGIALSSVALLALMVSLNQGEEMGGFTSLPTLSVAALGLACGAAFVWWEGRCRDPLLDLTPLRDRRLATGLLAALSGYVLLAGCNFVMPFYLVYVRGLPQAAVGLVMLAYSAVYVFATPHAGRLADRAGARRVSALGMLIAAASCVFLVVVAGLPGLLLPIAYLATRAGSYSLFIAPNNALVMGTSTPEDRGRVSALLKVSVNLSLVLGLVVFETMLSLPIAEGLGSLGHMLDSGAVSVDTILLGVQLAYGFGALACLLSAGAAWYGRERAPEPAAPRSLTPAG